MADLTADPSQTQNLLSGWNNAAQMAYYQSKLAGDADTLAFQKAQAAVAFYGNLSSAYGYAPGGDPYTFGPGGPQVPAPGTQTQSTLNQLGQAGAIPGYTGYNTGSTLSAQGQYGTQAQGNAGLTGQLYQPGQSPYSPGTFVQVDPSQLPDDFKAAGGTYALGYVLPSGQIQRLSTEQAQQMGYKPSNTQNISYQQYNQLVNAPPQGTPQQTLESIKAYQSMNQGQLTGALASAVATGSYQAPGQMLAPGYANNGSSFYQASPEMQQQYLSYYHDPQSAMQGWVNDTNKALDQASPGGHYTGVNTPGMSQETLAAQKQAADIANQQAGLTGYYNAPSMYAPGTYVQDPTSGAYYQAQSNGQLAPVSALPQGAAAVQGQAGVGAGAGQQGQMTTAYQQQQYQQWLDAQKQSLAQWQAQQTGAQNYLTLLSGLRGPADYAQYQKVLGSTPGGMKDLVAAAAGQYIPGGGATTGVAPTPVTLQNFVGSATGQQPGTADASGQAAMNSLVAPNQMAPQTWNALTPSQQQMLLGTWESQGYTKDDAQALFSQSLPKYATQSAGAGTFKLQ